MGTETLGKCPEWDKVSPPIPHSINYISPKTKPHKFFKTDYGISNRRTTTIQQGIIFSQMPKCRVYQ